MSAKDIYSAYDNLAWFYNKFWGKWTEQVIPVFEKLLLPIIPPHGLILDLCCGTGSMAAELTRRGYRVIGVDGSEEMLKFARINAPSVPFIHADARCFEVQEKCDAAFSTYDSLNHLETIADLKTAFEAVHRALRPEGPFFFDLNNDEGFSTNWKGTSGRVDEESAVLAVGNYDSEQSRASLALAMFRLLQGNWKRSDLTIFEYCFSDEEVSEALILSGFGKVQSYNSARDLAYKAPGRTFYLATAL